jgi:hypothetical protein
MDSVEFLAGTDNFYFPSTSNWLGAYPASYTVGTRTACPDVDSGIKKLITVLKINVVHKLRIYGALSLLPQLPLSISSYL